MESEAKRKMLFCHNGIRLILHDPQSQNETYASQAPGISNITFVISCDEKSRHEQVIEDALPLPV